MIGTIIGGLVVGGMVAEYAKSKKDAKAAKSKNYAQTIVIHQTVDKKLNKQVNFFDKYRALDTELARYVREGFKGVTYLEKGLEVSRTNNSLKQSLRNIRNYRNKLSHDKRQWKNIEEPSSTIMSDLGKAISWVNCNRNLAANMVYKGKKAFSNKYY